MRCSITWSLPRSPDFEPNDPAESDGRHGTPDADREDRCRTMRLATMMRLFLLT